MASREARLCVHCDSHVHKFKQETLSYFLESLSENSKLPLSVASSWDDTKISRV